MAVAVAVTKYNGTVCNNGKSWVRSSLTLACTDTLPDLLLGQPITNTGHPGRIRPAITAPGALRLANNLTAFHPLLLMHVAATGNAAAMQR